MTETDRPAFVGAYRRLSAALQMTFSAEGATATFDALAAYPILVVCSAGAALAKDSTWFPKPVEWAAVCERLMADQLRASVPTQVEPWHDECRRCGDTGWEPKTCGPQTPCGRFTCTRNRFAYPHRYVEACECRITNHTYLRRQAENRAWISERRKGRE